MVDFIQSFIYTSISFLWQHLWYFLCLEILFLSSPAYILSPKHLPRFFLSPPSNLLAFVVLFPKTLHLNSLLGLINKQLRYTCLVLLPVKRLLRYSSNCFTFSCLRLPVWRQVNLLSPVDNLTLRGKYSECTSAHPGWGVSAFPFLIYNNCTTGHLTPSVIFNCGSSFLHRKNNILRWEFGL